MVAPTRNSWDRMEGESDEWHARFLVFLGLGPGRSLLRAYRAFHRDSKAGDVSGSWRAEAKARHWQRRANDHDIPLVREQARESIVHLGRGMRAFARKAVRALLDKGPGMRPATWEETARAFETLWKMFPAETIHAVVMMGAPEDAEGCPPPAPEGDADFDENGDLREIPESDFPVHAGDPWQRASDGIAPLAEAERARLADEARIRAAAGPRPGETAKAFFERTGCYPPEKYVEPTKPAPPG